MTFDAPRLDAVDALRVEGSVRSLVGLSIRARLPGARVGELVEIRPKNSRFLRAEVVGFIDDESLVMPFGPTAGIAPGDAVVATGEPFSITVGDALLGRVLDGLGDPIDGGPALVGARRSVLAAPPNPLERARIDKPVRTGVRAIDAFLTMGEGQRVGLFAGSGVGKSTLLGQIARQADADVFVVALIGERGREVREFLEDSLGAAGLARGVVVTATSDAPPLARLRSAHVATSIAEHFRDQGKRVLLLVDSITRFARAAREVGLAAGEPPARRGYPPSVFAALPSLLERTGTSARGAISALYTVLVEGGDMEEPIADEVRGILDGHIVLERALGSRGRWPAIDVLQSLSRVMPHVTSRAHRDAAERVRAHLGAYEEKRDLVLLGAHKSGADARLDAAIARIERIEAFLQQRPDETSELEATLSALRSLV